MTRRALHIVLADDHPLVLRGLVDLLASEEDLVVVATCGNGIEALEAVRRHAPDIAVLDVAMPGLSGLEVLAALVAENSKVRTVLLTASLADDQMFDAISRGVSGLVLKDAAPDALVDCLREVGAGRRWLPTEPVKAALGREAARRPAGRQLFKDLTPRELQIAKMVVDGSSNKHIARRIGTTEGTVKLHLHNIYQKLGVGNRTMLARLSGPYI
jgi:DNA-binding NarL/FixJ family response regulator